MILSKLSVKEMLKVLNDLKDKNFEYFDIQGSNKDNQDSLDIITRDDYMKKEKATCIKLNNAIINALLN